MKNLLLNGMAALLLVAAMTACGNGGNNTAQKSGKTFAPQERTSSLSADQREAALTRLKKEAAEIDVETLFDRNSIRLSILQPNLVGDMTEEAARRISIKMLQMAAQNGISGLNASPNFVMGAEIVETKRMATGTAPQKMIVEYELTYKVMNVKTGDVYGTVSQDIHGVGQSFEDAMMNAVNEIKNTASIQQFLKTSCDRIVKWYDENVPVIKNQVETAKAKGDFDLASAILSSVPEQAKVAMEYVNEEHPVVLSAMLHKHAADLLSGMEAEIASAGYEFKPEVVGAYLRLIPYDSPEHETARQYFAAYETKCKTHLEELEAKAKQERDEAAAREAQMLQAQFERDLQMMKVQNDHELAMETARLEEQRLIAKYEEGATKAEAEKNEGSGLGDWLGLIGLFL